MKKLPLIFLILLIGGCGKLNLYGDTFYTVQGKISDSLGVAITYLPISILNTKSTIIFNVLKEQTLVSAQTETDKDGNFKITFPRSNGTYNILLPDGYVMLDSIHINSLNDNIARIADTAFIRYFADIKTLKVKRK